MKATLPAEPPAKASLEECIAHYEQMDLDGDGVFDWTSKVDGRTSRVLYPQDNDMDGDGIPNVMDPSPLEKAKPGKKAKQNQVPEHLDLGGEAGKLQAKLFKKHGILAVDHTDRHSPDVLQALLTILDKGLSPEARKTLESIKYLYAFAGHGGGKDIAAYHRQMQAISIGGRASYGEKPLPHEKKIPILISLSHELGHAYVFDRMSAVELRDLGAKFGNWKDDTEAEVSSFYDLSFFRSHPFQKLARLFRKALSKDDEGMTKEEFVNKSLWRESNITSEYAATNLHEWFADAFAAGILQRLGERGELGPSWEQHLVRLPERRGAYWANYNNLSPDFRLWLDGKLGPQLVRTPATKFREK